MSTVINIIYLFGALKSLFNLRVITKLSFSYSLSWNCLKPSLRSCIWVKWHSLIFFQCSRIYTNCAYSNILLVWQSKIGPVSWIFGRIDWVIIFSHLYIYSKLHYEEIDETNQFAESLYIPLKIQSACVILSVLLIMLFL